ncbi:MAG: FRG domain-containing protein [Polaromonas sp.]|uniref:FRG domain-containing protein n=1 Tax=Polaromonas sp. TaxID=1869339 RepID=UPI0025EA2FB5|nr:FRG domain-containing protein [Polaromonas sp.]MBI2725251.1 FRG domain-containing protein [Polaromonas sp.]
MKQKSVENVQSLIEALQEDQADYGGSVWYRGQAHHDWPLLPGYLRLDGRISESTLMKRFKQSASMLLDRDPKDSFDWLFLMQHYGLPTRLLDWSESPLVALYFAIDDSVKHADHDAAVWCLRPSELNKNANIFADEEFFIPSFEDEELKSYSIERLGQERRVKQLPVATIATRNNARIQAQLGVFTIHHLDDRPIEAIGNQNHVIKYTIPAASRTNLLEQLRLLGVSKFSMFPELGSIGAFIHKGLA